MVVHMNLIFMAEIRYGVELYPINQSINPFFFFLGFSECLDPFRIASMPFSRFIINFFSLSMSRWFGQEVTLTVLTDPEFRSCRSPKRPY